MAREVSASPEGEKPTLWCRIVAGLLLAMPCAVLMNCSNRESWVTTLKDGQQIESTSFPKLNETSGLYNLVDAGGEAHIFPENQVASIVQSSRD